MRALHVLLALALTGAAGCMTEWKPADDGTSDADGTDTGTDTFTDVPDDALPDTGPDSPGDTTDDDVPESCGNGDVDGGEECDDGNRDDGDGCDGDCTWTCESDAECDDGEACNGAETCLGEEHLCLEGEAPADGFVVQPAEPRLICLGGETVESACNDGFVDEVVEQCEDGNDESGDGCSSSCMAEYECVLTSEGGSPARFSLVSVHPDGAMANLASISVPVMHEPGTWETNTLGGTTRCGAHVYAALGAGTGGDIQALDVGVDGTLDAGPRSDFPGVLGLACDEDYARLYAMALEDPGTATVRMYAMYDTGELHQLGEISVELSGETVDRVVLLRHPAADSMLWLFGDWMDMISGGSGTTGTSIWTLVMGDMDVMEGPVQASNTGFTSMTLNADGTILYVPGYSGGCFGYYLVSDTLALPVTGDIVSTCASGWGSGRALAAHPSLDLFYMTYNTTTSTVVRTGGIADGGLVDHGTVYGPGTQAHPKVLYDGRILLVLSRAGELMTYSLTADPTRPASIGSLSLGSGEFLDSSAVVPCTR